MADRLHPSPIGNVMVVVFMLCVYKQFQFSVMTSISANGSCKDLARSSCWLSAGHLKGGVGWRVHAGLSPVHLTWLPPSGAAGCILAQSNNSLLLKPATSKQPSGEKKHLFDVIATPLVATRGSLSPK